MDNFGGAIKFAPLPPLLKIEPNTSN